MVQQAIELRGSTAAPGRPLAVAAMVCVPGVPVVGVLVQGERWAAQPVLAVAFVVELAALTAGALLAARLGQRANARLLLVLVVALSLTDVIADLGAVGPTAFVVDVLRPVEPAMVAWLLLRWPEPRLQHLGQIALVAAAWTVPNLLYLLGDLCYDPVSSGWTLFDPRTGGQAHPDWWPTVAADPARASLLFAASSWAWAVLLLAFVLLIVQRVVVARPRTRLVPVAIAAALVVVSDAVTLLAEIGAASGAASALVDDLALIALPAVLLTPLLPRLRSG